MKLKFVDGAKTLSIMAFGIMLLDITTLRIMPLGIMTPEKMLFVKMPLGIMPLSIM